MVYFTVKTKTFDIIISICFSNKIPKCSFHWAWEWVEWLPRKSKNYTIETWLYLQDLLGSNSIQMLYSQAAVHCICDNFWEVLVNVLRKRYGKQTFFLLYYVCFSNVILAVGYTEHENMWKDFFYKICEKTFFCI